MGLLMPQGRNLQVLDGSFPYIGQAPCISSVGGTSKSEEEEEELYLRLETRER